MFTKYSVLRLFVALFIILMISSTASARPLSAPNGTSFTYQGKLLDSGSPVNGAYDLQFKLFDALSGGSQAGSTLTQLSVTVTNGLFTVRLDFGNVFNGTALYLEIGVRPGSSGGAYTTLTPRQPLSPTPYALYATQAGSVPWGGLTGIPSAWSLTGNAGTNPASNYLGTSDPVGLTFKVGGVTALRLLPDSTSPNIIGGSDQNQVVSGTIGAVIGGGGAPSAINKVQGNYSVVGGGLGNVTNGIYATVSGGVQNSASSPYSSIGGGWMNVASGSESTVAGGAFNSATDSVATVGGGATNAASGYISTIGGGNKNNADGDYSTIAGGVENSTSAVYSVAAGGYKNNVTGDYAAIGGGSGNSASGSYAVIGGGGGTASGAVPNVASNMWSTVGGGRSNTASGPAATVGGGDGNTASAVTDTVPGGSANSASGGYSFAAGAQASATHIGSFVWSSSDATASWGDFTFTARADGGVRFYSGAGTSTGVQLSSGGSSWGSISDRNVKDNFSVVDTQWLLNQLAAMPIQTWNLKSQASEIRHIGPVAQDFNGLLDPLFGTVEDPLRINNMDAIGVSLAAIQGLYRLNQQQAAEIQSLHAQLAQMDKTGSPRHSSNLPPVWAVVIVSLGLSQAGMFLYLLRRTRGKAGPNSSSQVLLPV